MRPRFWKIGLAVAALGTLGLVGARVAQAHGPGAWQHHIDKKLGALLDTAKATPEQRAAVRAAVEHVTTTFREVGRDHAGEMDQALQMFEADKLDARAIEAHRAKHEAEMKKVSDAVVQALFDTHDAFTAPQRKALADAVRAQHAEHAGGGLREQFFKGMINEHIEDALDEAKVTDAQRAKVNAARDRVFAVIGEIHAGRAADLNTALDLFTADKIDAQKVEALRAKHQGEMRRAADAITQAVTEVHDTLDAGQRKAIVEYVRAHRPSPGHWGHPG
ncbi:MAG TPA: periplasmic heavy metal sensor [Polyangia bacterium]|nr:periplasmic heavy metal sensor [Polyangia bacterium]